MLKDVLARYGPKELDVLREASNPQLESLGVSSLLPSMDVTATANDGKVDTHLGWH